MDEPVNQKSNKVHVDHYARWDDNASTQRPVTPDLVIGAGCQLKEEVSDLVSPVGFVVGVWDQSCQSEYGQTDYQSEPATALGLRLLLDLELLALGASESVEERGVVLDRAERALVRDVILLH